MNKNGEERKNLHARKFNLELGICLLLILVWSLGQASFLTATAQVAATYKLTVNAIYMDDGSTRLEWITIRSGNTTVQAGYTPFAFTGNSGTQYTITVSDNQERVFDHWENGSTSRSRTVNLASATTITAYYNSLALTQMALNVNAANLAGYDIAGIYTTIKTSNNGTVLVAKNTQLTFAATSGTTYTVTPSDLEVLGVKRYQFERWNDGNTTRIKTVTPTSPMTLTAYYKSGNGTSQTVSVNSATLSGTVLSGIYMAISPATNTDASGYTPRTYTLYPDVSYTLTAQDYGSYVFDHWENGATAKARTITPVSGMALKAFFKTLPSTGSETVAPSVNITSPSTGQILTSSAPTISGAASDNMGITKIEVSVDGGQYKVADGLTRWSFNMLGLSDGSHSATVRASDISGKTKTATITFAVKLNPIQGKTGVYIPLFFYPSPSNMPQYDAIIKAKLAHPSVPIVAAVNPSSGPGSSMDANYASAVNKLKAEGITVIGYVPTKYGSRDIGAVMLDISKYIGWYAVDGIFLDEFASKAGYEDYYRQITAYAKSQGLKLILGNAGTDVSETYIGTVDSIGITEGSGYMPTEWLRYCVLCTESGWHYKYDKNNFWYVRYATSTFDSTHVREASKWVGLLYLTDGVSPVRWDHLPPYFDTLVATLDMP